jgi:hypothetical protein
MISERRRGKGVTQIFRRPKAKEGINSKTPGEKGESEAKGGGIEGYTQPKIDKKKPNHSFWGVTFEAMGITKSEATFEAEHTMLLALVDGRQCGRSGTPSAQFLHHIQAALLPGLGTDWCSTSVCVRQACWSQTSSEGLWWRELRWWWVAGSAAANGRGLQDDRSRRQGLGRPLLNGRWFGNLDGWCFRSWSWSWNGSGSRS